MQASSSSVVVYTANFGGKDKLYEPSNSGALAELNVDFVCVTDNPSFESEFYRIIEHKSKFEDVSKNARKVKILGFDGMENYDLAIWHDSSIQIDCKKIVDLIEFGQKHALSTFKHGREDVYLEAIACIENNKDRSIRIAKQMKRYQEAGVKAHSGLFETGILVLNVKQYLNSGLPEIWWNEIESGSRRDQLSLPFAQLKSGVEIGILKGSGHQNPYSKYYDHLYEHYIDSKNSWFSELKLVKKLAIRYIYKLRWKS